MITNTAQDNIGLGKYPLHAWVYAPDLWNCLLTLETLGFKASAGSVVVIFVSYLKAILPCKIYSGAL